MNIKPQTLRITLVALSALIILLTWLVWQHNHWNDYVDLEKNSQGSEELEQTWEDVKTEIRRTRLEWNQAKDYFTSQLNQELSTSTATTTPEIDQTTLEEMKNKINEYSTSTD